MHVIDKLIISDFLLCFMLSIGIGVACNVYAGVDSPWPTMAATAVVAVPFFFLILVCIWM